MPKPCSCDRPECAGVPRGKCPCPTCWAYYNDPRYRALWDGQPVPPLPEAVPPEKWSLTARIIARWKIAEDIGLGDTVARHLDRFGGDAFKRLYRKITGTDCSCEKRREKLNLLYPYAISSA